jgi:tetratricopeptide (TPR) repeat protein
MTQPKACADCGRRLNRYSPGELCGPCVWEARARVGEPPPLPPAFWTEPAMCKALAARDFTAILRIYLDVTGLTQEAVGLLVDLPQGSVSKIYKGARVRYSIEDAEAFRDGLRIPGHLLGLQPGHHEPATNDAPPDVGLPPPATVLGIRLEPLTAPTDGRRIGSEAVAGLARRVHGLRLADDVLAGRDLIGPAFRELFGAVRLYRETRFDEATGNALLVQIGELAQIVGWIASDAGQHDEAERVYKLGISAARQAGDAPLAANLAGSLAYQLSNTGREQEGVDLAETAAHEAGQDAPPKARALFMDRVAWAYTRVGQAQAAMRALGQAAEALSAADDDEGPTWAYWVSSDELEVMDARVFTELRRPLRAVPLLSRVLERYDAAHARELALYLSWLAVAYADANEPEQAAATARRMFDISADIASQRTSKRGRIVLRRLAAFKDIPEIRAVLADHSVRGGWV